MKWLAAFVNSRITLFSRISNGILNFMKMIDLGNVFADDKKFDSNCELVKEFYSSN